jgi:hypothetical protein
MLIVNDDACVVCCAGGNLAAGHGLGSRGTRLPSAVRYDLDFSFKDIYSREEGTHFNFSTPPLMIVSLRTFRNLIPEHQQPVKDTFGVSLVGVTATGFSVNVFRVDREGNQVSFDRGGRGWMQAIDIDWLAWEPWSEPHEPLDSREGTPVSMVMKRGDVAYFRTEVTDMTHDLTLRAGSVEPPLVHLMDAPEGAAGVAGMTHTCTHARTHADTQTHTQTHIDTHIQDMLSCDLECNTRTCILDTCSQAALCDTDRKYVERNLGYRSDHAQSAGARESVC